MHHLADRSTASAATTASQLVLTDVTKRYDDHVVLDRVSLTVRPGEKVGVIGDNGSGKSTLLRLIATAAAAARADDDRAPKGGEFPDNGSLTVHAPGGTGHLAQTLGLPGSATVGDAVDLALAELRALERRIRAAEARLDTSGAEGLAAYDALLAAFEARGGHDAERRVRVVLHRLGERGGLDRARPLGTLSGGQRSRLALAGTLAAAPELLLLDEPTNDLDDEAVAWLEDHLRRHRGTVVAVTHDRTFLERVTSTVLEVDADRRTVRRYGDGYAGYLAAKAAARARWELAYEEWRAELDRHAALADANIARFAAIPHKNPRGFSGAGAFRARSRAHGAQSRIRAARERIRVLTENPVPRPPDPLRFTARITTGDGGDPEGSTGPVVEAAGLHVPGRLVLDGSLRLGPGDRLLVTGPNGAGKTTLLKVLAGLIAPSAARTLKLPSRPGLLRQDDDSWARDGRTALQAFALGRPGLPEDHADALLALGLFREAQLDQPVRTLSVGQRRKLELARLVTAPHDLLLLDEPTNHLSPGLVEDLETALADYRGALVVVSHDRRVRARFAGEVLELR
ncbi:ABC-F family ATP-binding cassette domain-containing protein [Streptomyces sp. NPDC060194]|uniref:ABC-F family ATP-binding cassette domain-containing protein n=1 Tax=Streptomyces sp. NPDC060194 TaxID=3347069 RepID=UPI0036696713